MQGGAERPMGVGEIRVERERAPGIDDALVELSLPDVHDRAAVVRLRLGLVQLDGPVRQLTGKRQGALGIGAPAVDIVQGVAKAEIGVGRGEARIERDRALQQRAALGDVIAAVTRDQLTATQIPIVRLDVVGASARHPPALLGRQRDLERGDDLTRDLVLDLEDVGQLAVVALGPDVAAGRPVDQLGRDPDAVAGLAHAAFERMPHAELAAHLPQIGGAALVGEGGVARDHQQTGDLGEVGDDVLGDPVGEILLLGVGAHVLERQHDDRRLVRQGQRRAPLARLPEVGARGGMWSNPVDPHRARDVLDRLQALVLEAEIDLAQHLVAHLARDADAAGRRESLRAGRRC